MQNSSEDKRLDTAKPSIAQGSILFSICTLLVVLIGTRFQKDSFYLGIAVTEVLLILFPCTIFLLGFKFDVKKILRLNGVSIKGLFLILGVMIFSIPVIGVINIIDLLLIKQFFGKVSIFDIPSPNGILGLFLHFLFVAGFAAICEETLFRGVLLRSFERFGNLFAILLSSFLFGLMHADFERFIGTFLLGCLIGFFVYRSGSIFYGMFAHFVNNSAAVLILFLSSRASLLIKNTDSQKGLEMFDSFFTKPSLQAMITLAILLIFGIFFCGIVGILIYFFIKITSKSKEDKDDKGMVSDMGRFLDTQLCVKEPSHVTHHPFVIRKVTGLLWLLPGITIIGFIYYAQGLMLLGLKNVFVDFVLYLLRS